MLAATQDGMITVHFDGGILRGGKCHVEIPAIGFSEDIANGADEIAIVDSYDLPRSYEVSLRYGADRLHETTTTVDVAAGKISYVLAKAQGWAFAPKKEFTIIKKAIAPGE